MRLLGSPAFVVVLYCFLAVAICQDVPRTGASVSNVTAEKIPAGEGQPPCCDVLQSLQFKTNLPVILIHTGVATVITKEARVDSTFCTCGAPGGIDLDARAKVRVRGSSSARQNAKKSYSLRLTNTNNGSKLDFPLMGFPSDDEWIMYGPEGDKTLGMRNFVTYEMSRRVGRYASRIQYVEVFLNMNGTAGFTMDHYWGVYLVGENIRRSPNRVDIDAIKQNDTDLSGGYIIKYENNNIDPDEITFPTAITRLNMVFHYPDANWLTMDSPATLWAQKYFNQFEAELRSLGNWRQFIDEMSFIDYFLMVEITKNPDGYRGSTYMHKSKGSPLVAGPVWDYNEAYGLCCGFPIEGYQNAGKSTGRSGGSAISAEGWRFNICQEPQRCVVDPQDGISMWYRQMFTDPVFVTAVASRWKELRATLIPNEWFTSTLNNAKTTLMAPALRNYNRWAYALAEPGYSTGQALFEAYVLSLDTWIQARLKWMDQAMEQVAIQAANATRSVVGSAAPPQQAVQGR